MNCLKIFKSRSYLLALVGVVATPFFPSREAKCCSNASNKLAGACIIYENIAMAD